MSYVLVFVCFGIYTVNRDILKNASSNANILKGYEGKQWIEHYKNQELSKIEAKCYNIRIRKMRELRRKFGRIRLCRMQKEESIMASIRNNIMLYHFSE